MTTEQLSKAVYDKMHAEQQAFRRELLQMKPEDILDQAYVFAVREDILCAMWPILVYIDWRICHEFA